MLNQISKNSKCVFILGAGSSISHESSFPSINEFFSKAKELEVNIKKEFPELHQYIMETFGIDAASTKNKINIEAIFTNLEIDIERAENTLLQSIRHQILKLIQLILVKLINKIKNMEGDLNQFVKQLSDTDTIITFNWDILLDSFLGREGVLEWIYHSDIQNLSKNCYWNSIFNLTVHGENTPDGISWYQPYSEWNNKNGYLLKMHGSIDWVFCSNKLCRGFGKGFVIKDMMEQLYCYSCHEPVYPLLIPPVLNKQYRKYHLIRKIWNVALKEIETVEDLIIWGYSLPETDFYSSWLLRSARQNIKTLTLINPSVIKGKKEKKINKIFVNHFANIFKGRLKEDSINLYEKFEDYLTNLNVHKKYDIKQILT